MATATYTPSTSSSDLNTLWRKTQVGIVKAYGFGVPEYNALERLKRKTINWSAREITMELDLLDDINVASIPEGGKEARPASQKPVTATLTWILLNSRFTYSLTAKYIRAAQGTKPMLEDQFKNLTENNTGTTSLDLDDMYGVASLGGTAANRRVADLIRDNEYYAILTSAGTFREIVQASSVARSTNIVTTAANMSTTADGDLVVPAASVENTTNAGTDRNRWVVGVLDMMTSDSVHGVTTTAQSR
ncbi:MAG: hypothetical protein ACYSWU_29075, partial [Planctomycetota bacterium]